MHIRATIRLSFGLAAAFIVAGCGNYETHLNSGYAYVPMVPTRMVGSGAQNGEASNDPISGQPDPLMSQTNPIATERDPLLSNGADPMTSAASNPSGGGPRTSYGRYWINGSVSSGAVEIDVNGTPIGTFSSHVDQEVSRWCHKGENIVTFVHHPESGGSAFCAAHLQLYDGLRTASPLEFTYDTTMAASPPVSASMPSDQLPTYANGGITRPSIPVPGSPELSNPADSKPVDGLTDERMFDDNLTSSGKPTSSQ
jgi:hypothetical protein